MNVTVLDLRSTLCWSERSKREHLKSPEANAGWREKMKRVRKKDVFYGVVTTLLVLPRNGLIRGSLDLRPPLKTVSETEYRVLLRSPLC